MTFPAMVTVVEADTTARTVTVEVTHDPAQSYTRAILPRANKDFKRWISENIMFGRPVTTGVDYHDGDMSYRVTGRAKTTISYAY